MDAVKPEYEAILQALWDIWLVEKEIRECGRQWYALVGKKRALSSAVAKNVIACKKARVNSAGPALKDSGAAAMLSSSTMTVQKQEVPRKTESSEPEEKPAQQLQEESSEEEDPFWQQCLDSILDGDYK